DRNAVGACVACGRGVCPDCLNLVRDALACKGRCEERVSTAIKLLDNSEVACDTSAEANRRAAWTAFSGGALFVLMGGIFIYNATQRGITTPKVVGFAFIVLGAVMAVNAIRHILVARRYKRLRPVKI